MATLDFVHVRKTYENKFTAIQDLNMHVNDGEFIVIVGPSGCGKSTFMRMVAGLETISEGQILIDNECVNNLEPKDRNIAMVFQNYALYPHMTIYDNMAYGLKIRKKSREEISKRIEEVAQILELSHLLDRKPKQLSGGQRQRVAMGRAIVREPKIFLFDEPLSNLDAKLRVKMRMEMKKLHRRLRTTSLYVTHDQIEAMTLADRMIVMNKGNVEQIGTPLEVFHEPASTFVASFIGSPPMNLVEVDTCDEGTITEVKGGATFPLPASLVPDYVRNRRVIMGFRPEHISLGHEGIPFTIDLVETLGSEQLVHGMIGSTKTVLRADVRDNKHLNVIAGEMYHIRIDDGHPLHWFDPETKRRINPPESK
ncbi:sn-glycerol-3-phosphate import ATP-binding protein UgpC [Basilea psittacipulmonis]|uniref:Glycerol-3-phosphate transporter ATP-binding subunit n=1 Tax=Basilea psittacipulmonis DSM 24701 TaxID=1072685 RepID=A0A077DGD1_9BURK|nr:sn-glycerol-3-phosphate import ATP-binding protein UgpC [Basilea psittacipulmonis]AIL32537.1 glycerol-3-phosphate transporter ATP-binding subunit [Basilea psittacipulmonis DSM 24701]